MAQQSFAGVAVLVALAFALMALNACASSEQPVADTASIAPVAVLPVEPETTTPEFHGASIGGDALRSRLPAAA